MRVRAAERVAQAALEANDLESSRRSSLLERNAEREQRQRVVVRTDVEDSASIFLAQVDTDEPPALHEKGLRCRQRRERVWVRDLTAREEIGELGRTRHSFGPC